MLISYLPLLFYSEHGGDMSLRSTRRFNTMPYSCHICTPVETDTSSLRRHNISFCEVRTKACVCPYHGWALSSRLLTAGALVRAQVGACGICGRLSNTGAGFPVIFGFPMPILIPLTAPASFILELVTRWSTMISLTLRPLYSKWNCLR
jgi:hypothetical protein